MKTCRIWRRGLQLPDFELEFVSGCRVYWMLTWSFLRSIDFIGKLSEYWLPIERSAPRSYSKCRKIYIYIYIYLECTLPCVLIQERRRPVGTTVEDYQFKPLLMVLERITVNYLRLFLTIFQPRLYWPNKNVLFLSRSVQNDFYLPLAVFSIQYLSKSFSTTVVF